MRTRIWASGAAPPTRFFRPVVWLLLWLALAARADDLSRPSGAVILTVAGHISHTNDNGAAHFDRAMLEALGMTTLTTGTPWTDGVAEFSGVPLDRLLSAVGADSTRSATARALNDYIVPLPLGDVTRKKAFLAMKMNGVELTVRDKGPLWLIFPWDQDPALDEQTTKHQSIWQLRSLTVE